MNVVILDRDGVINYDSPDYIKSPEEWIPIPEAIEAIAALTAKGVMICVATNQSGLGRGYYSEDVLAKIHEKMLKTVTEAGGNIAHIVYCPHTDAIGCACRKPKPGMLITLSEQYNIPLMPNTPFVGDSLRDIQAAHAAGILPVWLGDASKKPETAFHYLTFSSLSAFKDWYLVTNLQKQNALSP